MDDFATYHSKNNHAVTPRHDDRPENSDRESLFGDNEGEIYTSAPKEAFKLGYLDVMCLVLNRMIGEC